MPYEIGNVYRKKGSFGLDIGTHSLKVCQLKKDGRLVKLLGYGEAEIPDNIIIEGIVSDPDAIAEIIKELISNPPWGKITANRVVASLPESKIFTRILQLPEMNKRQIEEAVYWEAEQYIPVPVADLYLDWEILKKFPAPKSKGKKDSSSKPTAYEILMVATPKSIVDSYLQVFKILNLEPMAVEMGLTAITRSLIPEKMKGAGLIVNIGANATDVGVVINKVLRLSGSSPVGGDNITQAIVTKLKVSASEASEIKKKFGLSDWGLKDKVFKAIEAPMTQITDEVLRIIKYYEERVADAKEKKIEQIFLTGGSANMPGFAKFIQEKLKIPTDLGNPWANITVYPLKPVPKSEVSIYSAAIGLALRGIQNNE